MARKLDDLVEVIPTDPGTLRRAPQTEEKMNPTRKFAYGAIALITLGIAVVGTYYYIQRELESAFSSVSVW
jgi:hypothetical protein